MRLKRKLELLGCYILVSEQFILIEPEDGNDYASKHNSMFDSYAMPWNFSVW